MNVNNAKNSLMKMILSVVMLGLVIGVCIGWSWSLHESEHPMWFSMLIVSLVPLCGCIFLLFQINAVLKKECSNTSSM